VSYIWETKKRDFLNWTICTWSKYVSHSFVSQHGNANDKQYLPVDYVYVPRSKKRDDEVVVVLPVENINNKRRKVNNNNNNDLSVPKSRKKKATTKQTNSGRTRSVADLFAASFNPAPAFLEQAKATANNDDVINVEDELVNIEESGDLSNSNSTDPSLIVRLPHNTNDSTIPNASRTTAADFEATVTTILDCAAGINSTGEKTD
jgi:hypothetical protein